MNSSKGLNPETRSALHLELPHLGSNSNYSLYQNSRKQRKQMERKRKELEETVALMKRKAQETQRKFNQTQGKLMNVYNKKLETVDFENQRRQFYSKQQKKLQDRRNMSSLSRYLHQVKKEEAIKKLGTKKKNNHNRIRSDIKQAEMRKKREKNEEIRSLNEKNKQMNFTMKQGVKWARDRSFEEKRSLSKNVRNDLISIESSRVQEEQDYIQKLEREKQKMDLFISRIKNKEENALTIKSQIQQMDLYDFEARVAAREENLAKRVGKEKSDKESQPKKAYKHYSSFVG